MSRKSAMLVLSCFVILTSCYVQPAPAASTIGTSACNGCMNSLLKEMLRVSWTTLETGAREPSLNAHAHRTSAPPLPAHRSHARV